MKWDKEQALLSVDGDVELLEDILLLFIDTYNADVARIEIAFKMQNWTAVAEAAHSIKGAAVAMGFTDLKRCAEQMEGDVKSGCYDNVGQFYNELSEYSLKLDELKVQ